ncbi:MAG: hypothetical protein KKA62_03085 [Nanoarchaeota archaeon]|nr:hypothetical protein [Nanoarchaeota archaeon]MBU1644015.1 hypothetical protein [Nanoarchaeota archaeon]MBU1976910.1 hypothetical protein [Nanoarchaeota archaeon]
MVIDFSRTLQKALEKIGFTGEHHELSVHELEEVRTYTSSDEIICSYGEAKWSIVDLLNKNYSSLFDSSFDLYNWLNDNPKDEVSYFLNEAGSNSLNYSDYKAPSRFHLWLGRTGFVIAIEQKGEGFDAEEVHNLKIKENEGTAFEFFRNCKSKIFFDTTKKAKVVFMEHLLP